MWMVLHQSVLSYSFFFHLRTMRFLVFYSANIQTLIHSSFRSSNTREKILNFKINKMYVAKKWQVKKTLFFCQP